MEWNDEIRDSYAHVTVMSISESLRKSSSVMSSYWYVSPFLQFALHLICRKRMVITRSQTVFLQTVFLFSKSTHYSWPQHVRFVKRLSKTRLLLFLSSLPPKCLQWVASVYLLSATPYSPASVSCILPQ